MAHGHSEDRYRYSMAPEWRSDRALSEDGYSSSNRLARSTAVLAITPFQEPEPRRDSTRERTF
jgi:hypothetical protein